MWEKDLALASCVLRIIYALNGIQNEFLDEKISVVGQAKIANSSDEEKKTEMKIAPLWKSIWLR